MKRRIKSSNTKTATNKTEGRVISNIQKEKDIDSTGKDGSLLSVMTKGRSESSVKQEVSTLSDMQKGKGIHSIKPEPQETYLSPPDFSDSDTEPYSYAENDIEPDILFSIDTLTSTTKPILADKIPNIITKRPEKELSRSELIFNALEDQCYHHRTRQIPCIFHKIKRNIEDTIKLSINKRDVEEINRIYKNCYNFRDASIEIEGKKIKSFIIEQVMFLGNLDAIHKDGGILGELNRRKKEFRSLILENEKNVLYKSGSEGIVDNEIAEKIEDNKKDDVVNKVEDSNKKPSLIERIRLKEKNKKEHKKEDIKEDVNDLIKTIKFLLIQEKKDTILFSKVVQKIKQSKDSSDSLEIIGKKIKEMVSGSQEFKLIESNNIIYLKKRQV
eukprot:GHVP01048999.1.p1 GENE.GHVP01048999.1~~GHVP01048999.1.p1  ORF type:complete len:386 (-),score=72.51 GHVP01048999.1:402-1559(-)